MYKNRLHRLEISFNDEFIGKNDTVIIFVKTRESDLYNLLVLIDKSIMKRYSGEINEHSFIFDIKKNIPFFSKLFVAVYIKGNISVDKINFKISEIDNRK